MRQTECRLFGIRGIGSYEPDELCCIPTYVVQNY